MKASIIIPAYNEEKTISRPLSSLMPGVDKGLYEIIVVCNGCHDNTAEKVASFGHKVSLVETDVASKSNALNLGDKVANYFPRIYLDADVVISVQTVEKIIAHLKQSGQFATAPRMKMVTTDSSWFVRAYYEVWQMLPYVREGMIGVGVYALSEAGRSRFNLFPNIISDDGYVRSLFKKEERVVLDDCYSVITAPKTIAGLLKIKTRSRRGVCELKNTFPELQENEIKEYSRGIRNLLHEYRLWPKVIVYLIVNLISRVKATGFLSPNKNVIGWERDESSREL